MPATAVLVPLLLAATAATSLQAGNLTCPGFVVEEFVGMTVGGHYAVERATSPQVCCAFCAKDSKCIAWTFHPDGGASGCALATCAEVTRKLPAGNFGGYRTGHAPDPEKGCGAHPSPAPGPDPEAKCAVTPPAPPAKKGSPNIVMFLMDDMDLMLGSWDAVAKTTKLLTEQGATATNWMIHTSVCCPSRSELVTVSIATALKVTSERLVGAVP
jgi:hypothetical protein